MRFLKLLNWSLIIRESASKLQWEEVLSRCNEMRKAGFSIGDPSLLPPILKACTKLQSFKQGISIHAAVIKNGLELYASVANSIVDFYVKCGEFGSALNVFHCTGFRDSVSWNVIIHGYLDRGVYEDGLDFFVQARLASFVPNISTLILVVRSCQSVGAVREGLYVHGLIIRGGFYCVVSVQNSLLGMYVRLCGVEPAQRLFDEMSGRDVISWSVLISAYAQSEEAQVALWLFQEMYSVGGVDPDEYTAVSVLHACANLGDIGLSRSIHGYVIRRGFEFDLHVGNALVSMYSKCMNISSAFEVFNVMPRKNTVSWNSMLSGLVHNDKYSEAFSLFNWMEAAGMDLDEVTVVNLLQICKNVGDAVQCKCIHSIIIRKGFKMNEAVLNSLLDAYGKCGMVELAWRLFERIGKRNLISWSTMIAGFTCCGMPDEAIALFQEMMAQEKPNSVTILSLLDACSILAEIKRSKWAHGLVIRNGMVDEVAISTALLDMYGKCGDIDASRRVFDEMPERNVVSWSAMIAACGINGLPYEALGLLCEMEFHGLKPNGITMLSVLSACSHGGLLQEGQACFEDMSRNQGINPNSEHYSCMVDMLGRAGDVNNAMEVIKKMPEGVKASASAWSALLSACRNHGNDELGRGVASHVLELEPLSSAGYLVASSMYAAGGLWSEVGRMRWLVKEKGVKVVAGYSLVHVNQRAHRFVAGDEAHPQSANIYATVQHLHSCIRERKHDASFLQ